MPNPLFRKVDCLSLPVPDLEAALAFHRDELGHELISRSAGAVGLLLPDGAAELVLHTDERPPETDLMVESAPEAVARFVAAGGTVLREPFEIAIGLCAIVRDPWGNALVLLDSSKGLLQTNSDGNVVEQA